jgi:2-polyprenyl-3-methyl-5-hydroxy-6-metoxy-1,4-benzoquinol methylase
MNHFVSANDKIDEWLDCIRIKVRDQKPDLAEMFETYAAEAKFGHLCVNQSLSNLGPSLSILEVGAGSMILSCQFVRQGYNVTALEPTSVGFSKFETLRDIVLDCAEKNLCSPKFLPIGAESLNQPSTYDFAFSINVMEHVADIELCLDNVGRSLKKGAIYSFVCPNYVFPYETHFNLPILLTKNLTFRVFKKKILNAFSDNPLGVWNSINWITTFRLRKYFKLRKNLRFRFGTSLLEKSIERVTSDSQFRARRTGVVISIMSLLAATRIHKVLKFLPADMHPIIDCKMEKL